MTLRQISLCAAAMILVSSQTGWAQTVDRDGSATPEASYRLKGDRALLPSSIRDDGAKTYLTWPPDAELPAVFVIDETGMESMVDAYVRDGSLVIDAVPARMVFRLDRQVARAERQKRRVK